MSDPKPCTDCPDKLQTPMTVAELRALLAEYSGDTPVWVGPVTHQRQWPHRVRVKPGRMFGRAAWCADYANDHPQGVEGICL